MSCGVLVLAFEMGQGLIVLLTNKFRNLYLPCYIEIIKRYILIAFVSNQLMVNDGQCTHPPKSLIKLFSILTMDLCH